MRLVTTTCLGIALAWTLASPVGAQIVNGGFEPNSASFSYWLLPGGATDIPGWTTTDTGVEWYRPTDFGVTPAPVGPYLVDLANYTYSAGGVRQTFATQPGTLYNIEFQLGTSQSSGRDGTCEVAVSADGQSQTFSLVNHTAATVYATRLFQFMADDGSATLTFRCLQDANLHFANLDGVAFAYVNPVRAGTWGAIKSLYR